MDPRRPPRDEGQWGGFGQRNPNFAAEMIALGEQSVSRSRENSPGHILRPENFAPFRGDDSVFAHMVKSDEEIRRREVLAGMQNGSQNRPPMPPQQPFPSQPFPPVYGGFGPGPSRPPPQNVYDNFGFPIPQPSGGFAPNPPQMMPRPPIPQAYDSWNYSGNAGHGMPRQFHHAPIPPPTGPPRPLVTPPRPYRELVAEASSSGLQTFSPNIDPISGLPVNYGRNRMWNERPRSEVRQFPDGRGGTVLTGGFDTGSNANYWFEITEGEKKVQETKEARLKMADDMRRENMMPKGRRGSTSRGGRGGGGERRGGGGGRRMDGRRTDGRGGGGHRNNGNRGPWVHNRGPQGPPIKTDDIDVMWNAVSEDPDPVEEASAGLHSLVLQPDITLSPRENVEEPEEKEPEPTEAPVQEVEPSEPEDDVDVILPTTSAASPIVDLLSVVMNGNEFFTNVVDQQVIVYANDFLRYEADKGIYLDQDTLSLLIDDSLYPACPRDRAPNQLPRPVILDGCAVAYSYDPSTFLPHWDGKTRAAPYHKGRVLPVKPLFLAAIHFIAEGFKTSILLPAYYEEPVKPKRPWCKVDNLEAFNALKEIGLLVFVEPDPGVNLYDTIKEKVHEVHGAFFSHPDVRFKYKLGVFEEGVEEGLLMSGNKDQLKIEKAECNSDERMMTIMFGGMLKQLHVSRHFSTYTGLSRGLDKAKGEYTMVKEGTVMYYTERDGDEHDDGKKMEQQLKFSDQVRLLLGLCAHFSLPKKNIRAIQLLLVIAYKSGVHLNEISEFVKKDADELVDHQLIDFEEPLVSLAPEAPFDPSPVLLPHPEVLAPLPLPDNVSVHSESKEEE